MYAHNNSEIDYFKIACANALMIRRNLKVPVTLVTDDGTLSWGKQALGQELVSDCFENIIEINRDYSFENPRNFSDTSYTSKSLLFYNCNHWDAYNLTPYDETLFIDCDYLIMSSALNNCWGSEHEVMIEDRIYSPITEGYPCVKNMDEFGIRQYWATVVYFKKTEFAEFLFSIVKHVQNNYVYYKDLYCMVNKMFRNDNAFSIAVHTLNGFTNSVDSVIGRLPISGLLMSWDTDDIHSLCGINDIILYAEKAHNKGNYILNRLKNTDVHIMNKWAINRVSDELIKLYHEDAK